MAPKRSKRVLRIQGLPFETSLEELKARITAPITPDQTKPDSGSGRQQFPWSTASTHAASLIASSSATSPTTTEPFDQSTWTLALHNAGKMLWKTATISFASEKMKSKVLKRLKESGSDNLGAGVEFSDGFERLTMLYVPETVDVE